VQATHGDNEHGQAYRAVIEYVTKNPTLVKKRLEHWIAQEAQEAQAAKDI
jgi:hypothetical protein